MSSVRELYEVWAADSELRNELGHSLEPRGADWLFEVFARLGPQPGDVVLDAGAGDGRHASRLVREHGVRAVALDPLPRPSHFGPSEEVEYVEGTIEELPFADASFDWIWCRDVLAHVDVTRGLPQLARVLRPGGALVAYVTVATDRLEPREAEALVAAMALDRGSLDAEGLEHVAAAAGLALRSVERLGSEWRERMIEDGESDPADDLLRLARLHRREAELVERFGSAAVAAVAGGITWGVYQLLGKLLPSVYVWERRA